MKMFGVMVFVVGDVGYSAAIARIQMRRERIKGVLCTGVIDVGY